MIEYLKKKYNLIRELGTGGMAKIYLVERLSDEKKYALKTLRPEKTNETIAKKRFKEEMTLISRVKSENVIKLIDYEWNDEVQYLLCEFVDGETLKSYINKKGRLTVGEAVDFGKQIALGLNEIHDAGIIHRDIKSQNIMINEYGIIKIIDFGIALNSESDRVTKTGNVIGSVQYLPPEFLKGQPPTLRSEIYSLGILLFEMLTGNVPFNDKTPEKTAYLHSTKNVPEVNKIYSDIPQSVANIIIKATTKQPTERHKNMMEIYRELDNSLKKEHVYDSKIVINKSKQKRSFVEILSSKTFLIWLVIGITITLTIALILIIVFGIIKGIF